MNQTFPRGYRLTQASDYQRVFDNARAFKSKTFLILSRESEQDHARLGLVIKKKNIPKAVGRNRLKRLVRESFRQHQPLRQVPVDLIVMVNRAAATLDNAVLNQQLQTQWTRLIEFYSASSSSS